MSDETTKSEKQFSWTSWSDESAQIDLKFVFDQVEIWQLSSIDVIDVLWILWCVEGWWCWPDEVWHDDEEMRMMIIIMNPQHNWCATWRYIEWATIYEPSQSINLIWSYHCDHQWFIITLSNDQTSYEAIDKSYWLTHSVPSEHRLNYIQSISVTQHLWWTMMNGTLTT